MPSWFDAVLASLVAVFASSGFWAWVMKKQGNRSAEDKLLMGLAHDRIVSLSIEYLNRESQSMTQSEYSNLRDFLFEPYSELCDNSSSGFSVVQKLMEQVDRKVEIVPDKFEV